MAIEIYHGYERIVDILEGGKKFTEDVIRENERLRESSHLLGRENSRLIQELAELKRQRMVVEEENQSYVERHRQIERQNASLLNLYVATHQLRSSLDLSKVLQVVREIVVNLLGSEYFEVVLYDAPEDRPLCLTRMNASVETFPSRLCEAIVLETLHNGTLYASTGDDGKAGQVCVPLKLDGNMLGALVVHSFLPHRLALEDIDFELIELLSEDVANVIYGAYVYTRFYDHSNVTENSHLAREIVEQARNDETVSRDSGLAPSWGTK